jgi:hypothetical protein
MFLNNEPCLELSRFNNVLCQGKSPNLKIRYAKIDINSSDFLKLIPQIINSKEQLHYVFKLGWEFWNASDENLLNQFDSRQKYNIINNLIEKQFQIIQ